MQYNIDVALIIRHYINILNGFCLQNYLETKPIVHMHSLPANLPLPS